MQKLVECVPNISEGRDQTVIDAVTAVIPEVDGVTLLDVDPFKKKSKSTDAVSEFDSDPISIRNIE